MLKSTFGILKEKYKYLSYQLQVKHNNKSALIQIKSYVIDNTQIQMNRRFRQSAPSSNGDMMSYLLGVYTIVDY